MTFGKRLTLLSLCFAVLGAVYALAGGGAEGLRLAMLLGGGAQIACAASAWLSMRERREPRRSSDRVARYEST